MTDQLEVFERLKDYGIPYPDKPFEIGFSPCHYMHPPIQEPFRKVVRGLKPNAIYLELGSLLGAGSTAIAMAAHPTLRAVCVDHWLCKANNIIKPVNATYRGQPVDFMRGIGTSLEHFLNNTFQYRDRIVPIKKMVNRAMLRELYQLGLRPDLIMIDDDHYYQPLIDRLDVIKDQWPTAIVILDDFVPQWDEVRQGLREVFRRGWYRKQDSQLLGRRLMLLKRSSPEYVNARATKDAESGLDSVAGNKANDSSI